MKPITFDLRGCARCDGDGHAGITFQPLTHPVDTGGDPFTHWALCPAIGEPIMLRFTA